MEALARVRGCSVRSKLAQAFAWTGAFVVHRDPFTAITRLLFFAQPFLVRVVRCLLKFLDETMVPYLLPTLGHTRAPVAPCRESNYSQPNVDCRCLRFGTFQTP